MYLDFLVLPVNILVGYKLIYYDHKWNSSVIVSDTLESVCTILQELLCTSLSRLHVQRYNVGNLEVTLHMVKATDQGVSFFFSKANLPAYLFHELLFQV